MATLHPPNNTQRDIQLVLASTGNSTCNGFHDGDKKNKPCRKKVHKDHICVEIKNKWNRRDHTWRYHPECAFNVMEIQDASLLEKRKCNCRSRDCPDHKFCHTHCRDSQCDYMFQDGDLRIRVGGLWFCPSCVRQSESLMDISVSQVGGFELISKLNQTVVVDTLRLRCDADCGGSEAAAAAAGPRNSEYASDRPSKKQKTHGTFSEECCDY